MEAVLQAEAGTDVAATTEAVWEREQSEEAGTEVRAPTEVVGDVVMAPEAALLEARSGMAVPDEAGREAAVKGRLARPTRMAREADCSFLGWPRPPRLRAARSAAEERYSRSYSGADTTAESAKRWTRSQMLATARVLRTAQ